MTVISYPIPPYANVAIQPDNYQPRRFVISAITLGLTTTITTTEDMDYVVGQLVRLIIPPGNGSRQLNEQEGYITSIPATDQVVVEINSTQADPFIATASGTQPQILAIGDIGNGTVNSSGRTNNITFIPGSFINIS